MPQNRSGSPETEDVVRWAICGASDIADSYIIPALQSDPKSIAVGVLSRDPAQAARFAKRHGLERGYGSPDALWADDTIDAIYIGTENSRHRDAALAAAAAGRHILCEKPLAPDPGQARDIIDACSTAGVLLAVNHNLRGGSAHRAAAAAVAAGALGAIHSARVFHGTKLPSELRTWRMAGPSSGGGAALDLTVHAIDLLRFLLDDEVDAVAAMQRGADPSGDTGETSIVGVLRFAKGTLATFHDSFDIPFGRTSVELFGADGSLRIADAMAAEPVSALTLVDGRGERAVRLRPLPEGMYAPTLRAFSEAIRGRGAPLCSGDDGLRAVQVAHAAITAAATGRTQAIAY